MRRRPRAARRALDPRQPFVDLRPIPERAVLRLEDDELAARPGARRAPRFLQQRQRQQPHRLGLGQQLDDEPAKTDRLGREIGTCQRVAGRGRIAFVEDQVDDAQHARQPRAELGALRAPCRESAGGTDLRLGADDSLRQRRRRQQEGARDLLGRQARDLAQREGDLGVGRERRVAAREDQAQRVVGDLLAFVPARGAVGNRFDSRRDVAVDRLEAGAAADAVDRLEAAGGDQPRHRVGGNAVARPLLDRGLERVLHRLFGEVEVAEQADQRRQHLARVAPEQGRDGRGAYVGTSAALEVDGHGSPRSPAFRRSRAGRAAGRSRRRERRSRPRARRGSRAG